MLEYERKCEHKYFGGICFYCQQLDPNKHLDKRELKLLYEFLKYQHIPYENVDLYFLIKKISQIVNNE